MKKILILLVSISAGALLFAGSATAANKADFNPSNIIDDYVFYNSQSMDASQIQNFLNSKNPNCDYNGTQSAADWGYPGMTHAQLAEHKRNGTNGFSRDTGFHAPPYKCLTMYTQNTPQMEAASGLCGPISAFSNRSAAQIIKDVSVACGINPQVLVILLEKEQSLITDNWPLNRQLEKATGFACPDTAPCNPAYGGFFYQVYHAARQFKVYQAYPNNYNYRAGRNNTIKWNPQDWCGTSSVYIQNQATAALYIYTPYRPNDAALNNLYGTGDGCSSYGNRNFWRIFTDWFGTTRSFTIQPELISRYNALGGVNGSLGIVSDAGYCVVDRSVCWQGFANGSLIYSPSSGAWESRGAIRERWAENGYQTGSLGFPIGGETKISTGGLYQQFQNGRIYWKEGLGAWAVRGAIGDKYIELTGTSSPLGYPTTKEYALDDGGVYQQFQNGRIYWKEGLGAWAVRGAIGTEYIELGGRGGSLGYPVSAEQYTASYAYQQFQNGRIYWKEGLGANGVSGPLYTKYIDDSTASNALGLPTSNATTLGDDGIYQQFQNGRIYSKTGLNTWVVRGAIGDRYIELAGRSGILGYPISAEEKLSTGGTYQQFQNGRIYWKEGLGAFSISGGIGDKYLDLSGTMGSLGYPTSQEQKSGNEKYQNFEHGTIRWSTNRGAWI